MLFQRLNIYELSDFNLCVNTTTTIILNTSTITINETIDSIHCGIGGVATFSAFGGGGAPYSYTLNPGNFINNIGVFDSLNIGAYNIVVTNNLGCMKSHAINVYQASALLAVPINSISYDETCYLSGDGSIDIIPSNPIGLTYEWNNGAVTQDITNEISGNYFVKISNASGDCAIIHDTILAQGINCGTVSGKVFLDSNSNCNFDFADFNIPNTHVQLSNGAQAITDYSGNFQFSNVPYGAYTISQNLNPIYFQNACVQPLNLTLNAANINLTNINFSDTANAQVDAILYISSSNIAAGFNASYSPTIYNNSNFTITGNLWFKANNNVIFNFSTPSNQGLYPIIGGDSIVWTNISIAPFSYISLYLNYTVPLTMPIGTVVTSFAQFDVTNFTDINLLNNYTEYQKSSGNAYDPNDKTVNPIGEGPNGNITMQDSLLNYQIRFQNTGTDSAHNIVILDTLSDKLDINSLMITSFSHPYKIEIVGANILKFKFENIMLPDSNVNEQASHGDISYSIKQKNTNQLGDVIHNTASIYFDFNTPIVTNTTINTIVAPSAIPSYDIDKSIEIYPNPAHDNITVIFEGVNNESIITVNNTLGQHLRTIYTNTHQGKNKIDIDVKDLHKGIYMLKVENGKRVSTKKIVIQ